eukprot:TRINITY_DN8428_c0_g2_i1.p2 TRINITY_DN8428_c0_g2~~TRINITY_DN8428_c0_g2_i1.p2  ORF type:complete len:199 (-),score=49.27 TRINITY_DN8428_c0_g2_i1:1129-1725(-)
MLQMKNGKSPVKTESPSNISILKSLIDKLQLCKSEEECRMTLESSAGYLRNDTELCALLDEPPKLPENCINFLSEYIGRHVGDIGDLPKVARAHGISPSFHLSPLTPGMHIGNSEVDSIPFPIDPENCGDLKNEMKKVFYDHNIDYLVSGTSSLCQVGEDLGLERQRVSPGPDAASYSRSLESCIFTVPNGQVRLPAR